MDHRRILSTFTILLTAAAVSAVAQDKGNQKGPAGPGMTLISTAFADGAEIPPRYTQPDPNPVSPHLHWMYVPAGTVTFILHMHDPDVASQKSTNDQLHWMVLNIPGATRELPENVPPTAKLPDGSVQLKNGGGVLGYRGPGAGAAGPHHHYWIELYALDTKLETRADVMKAIDGPILAKAVLVDGSIGRRN
jgi:Raf kinase inhibitor-like YbhB/YbcL family protein